MSNDMQTAHAIPGLFKDLDWLCALALAVPQPDCSIIAPANHHTAIFPPEAHAVDAAEVPAPPLQRSSRNYVPEKDLLVATDAGEPGIVVANGEIEDFVAVSGVGLDEAGFGSGAGGFGGVVEVDGAVTGACKDLTGNEALVFIKSTK